MVRLGDVNPTIWDEITELMEVKLKEFKFKAEDIVVDWRVAAASRKLERELFEQYGPWKDYILHPRVQYLKQLAEANIDFTFQLGEPLIPFATIVIVLFLMHKRVSNSILLLAGGLLFNINPFYIFLGIIAWNSFNQSKKPKQYKKVKPIKAKSTDPNALRFPTKFELHHLDTENEYKHILIGNDIATLTTAAYLSKIGQKCCVLQPRGVLPLEIHPQGAPTPVPLVNASVGKVDKYQILLDILSSDNHHGKYNKNRIRFQPIGNEHNGYMNTILKLIHTTPNTHLTSLLKGVEKKSNSFSATSAISISLNQDFDDEKDIYRNVIKLKTRDKLWTLRAGKTSLIQDICSLLAVDPTIIQAFLQNIINTQQLVYSYLFTKIVPVKEVPLVKKVEGVSTLFDLSQSSILSFVTSAMHSPDSYPPLASMAIYGAEECIEGKDASALCLASVMSHIEHGIFYPAGGIHAIEAYLMETIQAYHGIVYSDVPINKIVVDGDGSARRVIGVEIDRKALITPTIDNLSETTTTTTTTTTTAVANSNNNENNILYAFDSVVSGVGILSTFITLLNEEDVDDSTRQVLSHVVEMRPKMYMIYWIRGLSMDIQLSDADYIETLSQDISDINSLTSGKILSQSYYRIWSPSQKDANWVQKYGDQIHTIVVEMEAHSPLVTAKAHRFTKSPSMSTTTTTTTATATENTNDFNRRPTTTTTTTDNNTAATGSDVREKGIGPVIYDVTKSIPVTDPSLVSNIGYTIKVTDSMVQDINMKCENKIYELYPQLKNKIIHSHFVPPHLGGRNISNTIDKYHPKSLSAATNIPGLYLTGRDISTFGVTGDIQAGWVTANTILGYKLADLQAGRNISADLSFIQSI